MLFHTLYTLFLFLVFHLGTCNPEQQLALDRWPPNLPRQERAPVTFSKQTSVTTGDLDHAGLLKVAQAHYNWLLKQVEPAKNEPILVAAMWDPEGKKVWASTPPKKPRMAYLQAEAKKGYAPLWWNILKTLKTSGGAPSTFYNAEDNIYFQWETSKDARTKEKQYAKGLLMVVWGRFRSGDTPGELRLCYSSTARRFPTCAEVAAQLGVAYYDNKRLLVAPPDIDPPGKDGSGETCDPGEGSSRNPPIRDGHHAKRVANSCATPVIGPVLTEVQAAKLSISLASTDFIHPGPLITPRPLRAPPHPAPSCSMQNEDPDQGINSGYCVCEGSVTLPLLSVPQTAMATETCRYATIPTSIAITPTRDLGPATTDSKLCQVCTPVVNNEGSCSTIPGCVVQTAAVTVQAGSSPVHVGTMTGAQLYTSVSNALQTLCPEATQTTSMTTCATGKVSIGGVPYVEQSLGIPSLLEGEFVVSVESSSYNLTSLRDAMIKSAAIAAQNAATGNNCYTATYSMLERRRRMSRWMPRLLTRDRPYNVEEKITLCNTVEFAGVDYYNPWWKAQSTPGMSNWIEAHFDFEVGPGGDFLCDVLLGALDAFAVVAPEFAVEDIGLAEEIEVLCEQDMSQR